MLTFVRNDQVIGAVDFWWNCVDSRFFAGKMLNNERKAHEPKGVYRVRNLSEYNAGLIARGNVAIWINESVLTDADGARKQ